VERLHFILHCRHHGMSLLEIKNLLAFQDGPKMDCDWINGLVKNHIDDLSSQIKSLIKLKKQLQQLMSKCSGGKKENCGILKRLNMPCPHCKNFLCAKETILA
jgi:DNA-binding transcriptional MerR regulator